MRCCCKLKLKERFFKFITFYAFVVTGIAVWFYLEMEKTREANRRLKNE